MRRGEGGERVGEWVAGGRGEGGERVGREKGERVGDGRGTGGERVREWMGMGGWWGSGEDVAADGVLVEGEGVGETSPRFCLIYPV